jgi:hypothetical protein
VLRETTSRSLCGLICPSRTSERGKEGDCVKEGGGEEGERERERALGLLHRCYYATALDIEVDHQRRRFGCRESHYALERPVECRTRSSTSPRRCWPALAVNPLAPDRVSGRADTRSGP